MEIVRIDNNNEVVLSLVGRLDTTTSAELEEALTKIDSKSKLVFDLKKLEYVSSAGLRVILKTYKTFLDNFKLINVLDSVKEVLDITGFTSFLNID